MNDIAYYVDSINFCRREKFASVQCSFPLKGQYHYLLQYSQTSVLYLQLAAVVCGGRAEIIILFLSPVIPPTPSLPPAAHQEGGGWGEVGRGQQHRTRIQSHACFGNVLYDGERYV